MELHNNFQDDLQFNFITRKDPYDPRDLFYKASNYSDIKDKVDLREWCSPVEEQLHLGSCVGQSIIGAFELLVNKNYPNEYTDLSRLFVYYNARVIEGDPDADEGVYVRAGIKAVNKWGVCTEEHWPYLTDKFATIPDAQSYLDAKTRSIKSYLRIKSIKDMISTINSGYPIVTGIEVFGDFDDLGINSNPIIALPSYTDKPLGGHAITIVGYDNDKKYFICRNSYGEQWGDMGYFYMPYDYTELYASDAWTFDVKLGL